MAGTREGPGLGSWEEEREGPAIGSLQGRSRATAVTPRGFSSVSLVTASVSRRRALVEGVLPCAQASSPRRALRARASV